MQTSIPTQPASSIATLPIPDAVLELQERGQETAPTPNDSAFVRLKGTIPDGSGDKPTPTAKPAPKRSAPELVTRKNGDKLAFEKKYRAVIIKTVILDVDRLNLRSWSITRNKINGARKMRTVLLANKDGDIIATIPKGRSIKNSAEATRALLQTKGTVYVLVCIKRPVWYGWKPAEVEKACFTNAAELFALIKTT